MSGSSLARFVPPTRPLTRHVLGISAAVCVFTVMAWIAPTAEAGNRQPCAAAEGDTIDVDGMLDDWDGVGKARAGSNAPDASFDLRCLYDGSRLFLSIDVRDEYVIRSGKTSAGEDRVEIALTAGKAPLAFTIFPGKDRAAPRRLVAGKPAPRWLTIEDTLQPKGWSVELIVPLSKVEGWGPSLPAVSATVTLQDTDVAGLSLSENTVAWSGDLALGNADSLHAQVLADLKLTRAQVTLDATADLDATRPGPERVIAGGTVLALVTDGYGFVQLPAQKPADVTKVQLVDLAGDGRTHVVVTLRQRGGGGSRDLLVLYGARNGKLEEVETLEIGKQQGDRRLASTWTFESAKAWKQAKGAKRVLVVRAGPATGWDEDSFAEAPSPDAEPIHVPWDDDRVGGVYWLGKGGVLARAAITR